MIDHNADQFLQNLQEDHKKQLVRISRRISQAIENSHQRNLDRYAYTYTTSAVTPQQNEDGIQTFDKENTVEWYGHCTECFNKVHETELDQWHDERQNSPGFYDALEASCDQRERLWNLENSDDSAHWIRKNHWQE